MGKRKCLRRTVHQDVARRKPRPTGSLEARMLRRVRVDYQESDEKLRGWAYAEIMLYFKEARCQVQFARSVLEMCLSECDDLTSDDLCSWEERPEPLTAETM